MPDRFAASCACGHTPIEWTATCVGECCPIEAAFRFGYRMGLSRGSNDETEDDVVRLWQHKTSVEAEGKGR